MNEIGRRIVDKIIEIHGSKDFKIAFLPYKRSMWNSMQSVYEECIKSGIDAHVYPIPYLRMSEFGIPDYIDSDFKYFENAERIEELSNPDYVVIHYYFDDMNRVTNMLPKYYTSAIKERYKCKVIFLPYGIKFDDSFKGVLYPGFKDCDYIFAEEIDENFIEQWKKAGVDFTGRIFAYGSPKLDIAHSMKDKRVIPNEWKEIIDGRSTTLILNSLIAYINNPYKRILDYLGYAVQEVSKGRAVIFRPHPLLKTTIKSMRQDTKGYYEFLLYGMQRLGAIIDESEYLERAMLASDYLISDPSSVAVMWAETGKEYKIIGG